MIERHTMYGSACIMLVLSVAFLSSSILGPCSSLSVRRLYVSLDPVPAVVLEGPPQRAKAVSRFQIIHFCLFSSLSLCHFQFLFLSVSLFVFLNLSFSHHDFIHLFLSPYLPISPIPFFSSLSPLPFSQVTRYTISIIILNFCKHRLDFDNREFAVI